MKTLNLNNEQRWYVGSVLNDKKSSIADLSIELKIMDQLRMGDFYCENGAYLISDEQRSDKTVHKIAIEDSHYSHLKKHFEPYQHAPIFKQIAISVSKEMGLL